MIFYPGSPGHIKHLEKKYSERRYLSEDATFFTRTTYYIDLYTVKLAKILSLLLYTPLFGPRQYI
jgi:hypothetical protein